jgi:S-methylmethionine-dependent homocysteine/selenocysteine methylase
LSKGEILIIDGGMGGELQRRSGQTGGLWSAQALLDDPELVSTVHADYVASGAKVIITNTYSTIPSYLAKAGIEDKFVELADVAGQIARKVADEAPDNVLVAGSLPPLGESYRWDLVPPDAEARPVYLSLAQTLLPYVDLFICETMSCIRESVNAVSAARQVGGPERPVWVAWTLAEQAGFGLRSGETITNAVSALADFKVDGFLFNCTTPEAISAGVAELAALTDKPIGAYPNQFHVPQGWTLDNELQVERSEMSVETFLSFADTWQKAGVSMIGGCCGIGPEYIHALSRT